MTVLTWLALAGAVAVALVAAFLNAGPLWAAAALENGYVLVSRDDAPCEIT